MNQQPYQRASDELVRQSKVPGKLLKNVASVAGSVAAGGTILGRIMPFLNQYIPEDLMEKGISKIEPRLGNFIKNAKENGYELNQIKDYITEKLPKDESKKPMNTLQDFEMNYPKIAQAISMNINSGADLNQTLKSLRGSPMLKKDIEKLEKETGKNFVDYVLELFGNQQQQQSQMQPEQPQQQMEQPQGQGGGLDQQIMSALDRILKM